MSTAIQDGPIDRLSIDDLTDTQFQNFIEQLRVRRMAALRVFEEASRLKEEATRQGQRETLERHLRMYRKEATRADNAIKKLEDRVSKIRVLRFELTGEVT